jgi:hypothetical protein
MAPAAYTPYRRSTRMASPSDIDAGTSLVAEPIYIGTSTEALIEVQLDAWERGYQMAVQAMELLDTFTEIASAAENACHEALRRYIPLDEERFCDIFTLAWCAGYCSFKRENRSGARRPKHVPTACDDNAGSFNVSRKPAAEGRA